MENKLPIYHKASRSLPSKQPEQQEKEGTMPTMQTLKLIQNVSCIISSNERTYNNNKKKYMYNITTRKK